MGYRLGNNESVGSRSTTLAKGRRTSNTAAMATGAILGWSDETKDTDSAFNPTSGTYTVPRDMRIRISVHALVIEQIVTTKAIGIQVRKNGGMLGYAVLVAGQNLVTGQILNGDWEDDFAAGDVIDLRAYIDSGTWSMYGADGAGNYSWVTLDEVPARAIYPASIVPVVTSLPSGANWDGREVDFLADATNGVLWRMRYRSATTRWHFVGGAPLRSYIAAEQGTSVGSNAYVDLTTAGPDITFPFAGDFDVAWGSYNVANVAAVNRHVALCPVGSQPSANNDTLFWVNVSGSTAESRQVRTKFTVTAGQVKRMRYFSQASAGTSWWGERWIETHPFQSATGF